MKDTTSPRNCKHTNLEFIAHGWAINEEHNMYRCRHCRQSVNVILRTKQ